MDTNFCQCGCGSPVKGKFLRGHNSRGVVHSEEYKLKMSEACKNKASISEQHRENLSKSLKKAWEEGTKTYKPIVQKHSLETRQKMSEQRKGRKLTEEHKQKILESRKYYKHSEETRKKMSSSRKEAWNNSTYDTEEFKISASKNKFGVPGYYKNVWMRSGIERDVARFLDSRKIDWLYESKRFWLLEMGNTYLPDFYLPNLDVYLEVKYNDDEGEKAKAFREEGNRLIHITKNNFKEVLDNLEA